MASESPRITWDKHLDFLLSTIGFAVDLANVWRFPYLVYVNGGGAFLVPYFLILILAAFPSFYFELLLGQTQRQSAISVWKVCPLFKGVGYTQFIVNVTVMCYYNVIIGWSLYYLFATITNNLPWMRCGADFRTSHCKTVAEMLLWQQEKANLTANNITLNSTDGIAQLASNEYFERAVLGVQDSTGLQDVGWPRWNLAVCSLIIFVLLFFCLRKGVQSSGKVVYVTAVLPYVLLTAMLVQGVLLPGSKEGIEFFIVPDFSKLRDPQVWFSAASQIFFSVGSGFGIHITFASYNKPNPHVLRDCFITAIMNSLTSLLAGFVVFAYLGYMSGITGLSVEAVANEGPGLVFQVYPIAVGSLPAAPLWSLLFFLLIIMLGLDSSMGGIESLVASIRDEHRVQFPKQRSFPLTLVLATFIFIGFGVSLAIVTNGGILVLQLMDYSVGIPLLLAAALQLVGITWFYGLYRFCEDVKRSCGYVPGIVWQVFWKIITPIIIFVLLVLSLINLPPMFYRFGAYHPELAAKINLSSSLEYQFPDWSSGVFWGLCGMQLAPIPLVALIVLCYYKSFFLAVTPTEEQDFYCRDPERRSVSHWFSFGSAKKVERSYSLKGIDNPAVNAS